MMNLYPEAEKFDVPEKDQELFERDTTVELTLRHGIRVKVNVMKLKSERRPIFFRGNNISRRESLFDVLPPKIEY
jgi:hypothetical protein